MTKNQKIAAGCGALGCLGLIVVVIAAAVIYFYMQRQPVRSNTFNTNSNSHSNSDSNSDSDSNSNSNLNNNKDLGSNQNTNGSSNSATPTSSSDTSSSMSDDDKHKLFQAVGITRDTELMQKVLKKIGLTSANGVPTDAYGPFMKDHISWAVNNVSFIESVNTPEKAKAYVDEHLRD